MKKNIIALIAARMGSSRLPGKTLMPIVNVPMLGSLVERIRCCKSIDKIVLATTDNAEDNELEKWCKENNIGCYRGSSDDVLLRLKLAAKKYRADYIVELLGDNPLVHSDLIDSVIDRFLSNKYDYVATVTNEYPNADKSLKRFPIGVRVQMFSYDALELCDNLAKKSYNREHATTFIGENPSIFKTSFVEAKGQFFELNRPELNFAVNYDENMELIRFIFNRHIGKDRNFTIESAIQTYDDNDLLHNLMGCQEVF
jgi:spore coat polysaccharide biosynthesis protein SpsF